MARLACRRIKLWDLQRSRSFLEISSWKRIRSMSSFLPKGFLVATGGHGQKPKKKTKKETMVEFAERQLEDI